MTSFEQSDDIEQEEIDFIKRVRRIRELQTDRTRVLAELRQAREVVRKLEEDYAGIESALKCLVNAAREEIGE